MTDNFEDTEHQETVHPEEPQTGARSNLAEAWRTRPLFKLLVVMVIAGALVAVATTIFSGGKKEEISRLINPPEMHEPPGGKISPYMLQQTKEAEAQRAKEALATGQSALPTPIGQPSDISVTEKTDPMNELRAETEHLKQQISQMQLQQTQQQAKEAAAREAPPPQQPQQKPEQFDQQLSQAMQTQMRQLMDSWVPKGIKQTDFSKVAETGSDKNGDKNGSHSNGAFATPVSASAQDMAYGGLNPSGKIEKKILISAGTINYGQLLTEANSDLPLPIMTLIVSGPLKGARAIGEFLISEGMDLNLVLHFKTASLKGKTYKIDAYAIDPETTLGGFATETDQRYFTRLILPVAASFISGFGQVLGTPSSTTTTSTGTSTIITQGGTGIETGLYEGLGKAADVASQFFQNQANKVKPFIRVAPNTPMGIFFITDVEDPDAAIDQKTATNPPPGGIPGYPGFPSGYGGYGAYLAAAQQAQQAAGGYPGGAPGGGGSGSSGGGSSVPYPNYAAPSQSRSYGSPFGVPLGYGYR